MRVLLRGLVVLTILLVWSASAVATPSRGAPLPSSMQTSIGDNDSDGIPDDLDTDDDNDGIMDAIDPDPFVYTNPPTPDPTSDPSVSVPVPQLPTNDNDGDGLSDDLDPDDDNDGIPDSEDPNPLVWTDVTSLPVPTPDPLAPDQDTDGDGIPNDLDPDDSNNGVQDRDEPTVTPDPKAVPPTAQPVIPGSDPSDTRDPSDPIASEPTVPVVTSLPSTGVSVVGESTHEVAIPVIGLVLLAFLAFRCRAMRLP